MKSTDNDDNLQHKLRQRRNIPPEHGIRVPAEAMEAFIASLFERAGTNSEDAHLLGMTLTANDLRCIFSHGTNKISEYLTQIRAGGINPRPQVRIVHEASGALVLDGDGGLGYPTCWRGTEAIIAKAKKSGSAVLTTRNHHHFGAAGNYTRLAVEHGCIGLAVSNHRTTRQSQDPIYSTISSSPLSIGVPTGEQPPLILDMAGGIMGFNQEHFGENPSAFFKAFGLSNLIQVLGGAVAGIYLEACTQGPWISNQGSFIAVFDTAHLMPPGQIQAEVDQYVASAREMTPVPGMERSELAGGYEWAWEKENREWGIPLGDEHRAFLEQIAAEWDLESPFAEWEATRF